MPEPCPRATQLWDVPCPDPPPGLSCPSNGAIALAAPDFGLAHFGANPLAIMWGSLTNHAANPITAAAQPTGAAYAALAGRCLTWLWAASLSCSAGPAPCTRDESVSARFAVGVGCTRLLVPRAGRPWPPRWSQILRESLRAAIAAVRVGCKLGLSECVFH